MTASKWLSELWKALLLAKLEMAEGGEDRPEARLQQELIALKFAEPAEDYQPLRGRKFQMRRKHVGQKRRRLAEHLFED